MYQPAQLMLYIFLAHWNPKLLEALVFLEPSQRLMRDARRKTSAQVSEPRMEKLMVVHKELTKLVHVERQDGAPVRCMWPNPDFFDAVVPVFRSLSQVNPRVHSLWFIMVDWILGGPMQDDEACIASLFKDAAVVTQGYNRLIGELSTLKESADGETSANVQVRHDAASVFLGLGDGSAYMWRGLRRAKSGCDALLFDIFWTRVVEESLLAKGTFDHAYSVLRVVEARGGCWFGAAGKLRAHACCMEDSSSLSSLPISLLAPHLSVYGPSAHW